MQPRAAQAVGEKNPPRGRQIVALALFNLLLLLVSPYLLLQKLSNYVRKKRRHELDWRRWFIGRVGPDIPLAPLPGPRVVLMALAFGELRLIEAITERLKAANPSLNVIWAVRDLATIELCEKAHPNQPVVIWPFDYIFPILKWARQVRPDAIVLTERIWPATLLSVMKLRGVRTAIINARVSQRDREQDGLKRPYYRWIVQNVDFFCFQSEEFLSRVSAFLRPSTLTLVSGNMKMDQRVPELSVERKEAIRSWLSFSSDEPLLAAGSTGPPVDEQFVIDAFKQSRLQRDCRLLIAPRSPFRIPDIVRTVEAAGLSYSLRSCPSAEPSDVFLLDTMGELAYAYQFCQAAFVGGTINSTGHNVIEPVLWGIPVSYGPRRGHFEDLQKLCEAYSVGFRCHHVEDLSRHWTQVLTDEAFRTRIRESCSELVRAASGAADRSAEALLELIESSNSPYSKA